jgi:hypothetical protein
MLDGQPADAPPALAAELLKRWNAHPELLAALEAIVETDPDGRPMANITSITLNSALAAIKKGKTL